MHFHQVTPCAQNRMDDKVVTTTVFAAAAVATWWVQDAQDISTTICTAVTTINQKSSRPRALNGRYRRSGALPLASKSFWKKLDEKGDALEFLDFTSLARESIDKLVMLCGPHILSNGFSSAAAGAEKQCHINRRLCKPRDVVARTLRYLLSTAEHKDLHIQFGVVVSTYIDAVQLGIKALVKPLFNHKKGRIFWDQLVENLHQVAERTASLLDIPDVVAMIDGTKVETKASGDHVLQNRDYNGWTKDVKRNLVLVWDPFGKIVDAAINLPGNFHNSKSAWWCKIYKYLEGLPPPSIAFVTTPFTHLEKWLENWSRPKINSLKEPPGPHFTGA